MTTTTNIDPTTLDIGDVIRTSVGEEVVILKWIVGRDRFTDLPVTRVKTDWTDWHNQAPWEFGHVKSRTVRLVRRGTPEERAAILDRLARRQEVKERGPVTTTTAPAQQKYVLYRF